MAPDGGPAFPCVLLTPLRMADGTLAEHPVEHSGLSLRDYFAAHAPPVPAVAMEARINCIRTNEPELMELPWNVEALKLLANLERRWRYAFADVMIAERNKPI